jgi:hypothetical protein
MGETYSPILFRKHFENYLFYVLLFDLNVGAASSRDKWCNYKTQSRLEAAPTRL